MKNLQEIIDRYKDQVAFPNQCPTGFLAWGGKQYYRINSIKPISLNSTFEGFILDRYGRVEEYRQNSKGIVTRQYKSKLNDFYPHPYFPGKKPKKIEVIRIMPAQKIGDVLPLNAISIEIAMQHPEFFKPTY